jgi:NAD(P)-dependent dehydrogenase (short-subunit alcohol dehydrogenase family)
MTVQARWDFSGQTAIVTGAGGDIGRDIALRFAREGANVIVVDVNLQTAQETQQLIEKGRRFRYGHAGEPA